MYVFLGDGVGGLAAGSATAVGAGPRALVAGYFNSDATSTWRSPTPPATASRSCWATATARSRRLSAPPWPSAPNPRRESPPPTSTATWTGPRHREQRVRRRSRCCATTARACSPSSCPTPVAANPTAVALLDLAGDPAPDIAVTSSGNRTLAVLTNSGGTFGSPERSPGPELSLVPSPRSTWTPTGGSTSPCPARTRTRWSSLLAPPGPPLLEAPRVGVGDQAARGRRRSISTATATSTSRWRPGADDSVSLLTERRHRGLHPVRHRLLRRGPGPRVDRRGRLQPRRAHRPRAQRSRRRGARGVDPPRRGRARSSSRLSRPCCCRVPSRTTWPSGTSIATATSTSPSATSRRRGGAGS